MNNDEYITLQCVGQMESASRPFLVKPGAIAAMEEMNPTAGLHYALRPKTLIFLHNNPYPFHVLESIETIRGRIGGAGNQE